MKTIISERGQITIPKEVRVSLGLKPGTILDITVVDGKIVGTKKEPEDRIHKWRGRVSLPSGFTRTDEYLKESRG